jgi:hypothetical protein
MLLYLCAVAGAFFAGFLTGKTAAEKDTPASQPEPVLAEEK